MPTDGEVRDRLVRIESKLDRALTDQADHEVRLRKLERFAYIAIGLAAASGVVGGSVAGLLTG